MKQTGTVAALLQLLLLLLMQQPGIWAAESPDRYNFTVHENRPAGFQVGQVKMSSGFAYQLSPDSPLFSFDPGTGIVTTKSLVDREALSSDVIDLLVIGTSASSVQTISVRVNVLDENDNSPRFPDATVGWDLSENSAVGSGRLLPLATDPDAGANSVTLNYKIVAGNEAGKFHLRVESSLGFPQLNLITVARLDRETAASYSLNISAEDGGNPARHGYLAVSVTVLDYNDNPPVFEAASVTAVVNESTPVGSVLATGPGYRRGPARFAELAATESKVGPAGGQFALDAVSGVLTLARPLDCFRTSDGCSVTVEAADAGTPQLMSEPDCLITISVQLANSNPPEIRVILTTQKDGFAIIDETSKPGDALAIVQVTDADVGLNGETSLALLNSSGYFALASLTSLYYQIVTAKAFDAESPKQFALLLLAQDKGNPPLTSTLAVRVQVNRANQFAPEFDQPLIDTKLSEAAPVGSLVATLVARDNDSAGLNSQVQYQIVEGNVDGAFGLVPDTGLLVTRQPLSLASRPAYRLNISASDMGPKRLVSYALVTVGLQGVNHPPACNASHLSYAARPWGSALTVPLAALCADADQDRNGSLTFSVRRRRPPTDTQCSVTTSSGGLQQLDCPSLTASAQYAIRVADNADKPLFADLTIEIEVSRPLSARPKLYPALYLAAVPAGEQWFGAELARIRAPNSGTNATFAFDSGSTVGFAIDSADGTVRLAGYAADAPVEFSVSVTDSRGAKASSPATVRVFPVPAGALLRVRSAAGAFYVIADGDPAGLFSISPAGVISLTGSLDREATPQFNLTVAFVTSADFCTVAVRILVADINDNSPAFEWSAYDFAVNESSTPLGHVIGVLTATDPDLGLNGRVTLELASNPGRYFSLDSSAGLLYLARPVPLWKAADLASGGVTLTVRASDAGSPSRSAEATVRVSVSVTPPPWPKLARSTFSFALFENASVNSEFGRVALAVGASEAVEFALSPEFAPLSLTDTQQRIGLLPSGGLYVARPLDRETRDTFELPVFARFVGAGPAAGLATASVVVHVGDINDCAPVFGGSGAAGFVFQLAENRTAGQPVGRVFAADADAGPNGQVQYWLAGTADFALRALRTFDRELPTERQFLFTVVAADGGEPTLTSTAAVRVVIADVNDCEPRFSSAWLNVSVAEDAAEGAVVARLTANDEDAAGDNSAVSFAIVSGNELGHFALSEVTGELRVAKLLDYEAQNSFRLVVTAADRGSPPLISSATILLRVTNVNDHRPAFANATQPEASVSEAAAPGTVLYRFRASDEDAGDSERLVFSITAGNSGGDIGMDASTGRLYVANALDFETRSSYSLTVRVADAGGLAAKTAFVVRVLNVNDNPPTFKQAAPLVLHAPENLTAPALLGRVVATDADIGDSISYRLVFQEPFGDEFAVDARSGEIRAVHSLDRERVAVYKLHLAALDSPVSAQLTSTATVVTVIVDDVDDNQPILLTPPTGDNALISFGLAGSDASMFAVDRSTGVVTLLADPAAASTGRAFYNLSVLLAGAEPQPLLLIGQSQDGSGPVFTQTAYWA
uniref:Cadherin domain-containing protein n=1 Tax=Macrostomum lignano TaxID=282301 RepID=A0A1I8JMY8_9PLAT